MASTGPRLAVNPIPYWLSGTDADKSTANLARACEELAAIGYTAVKADVPSDMEPSNYLSWLRVPTVPLKQCHQIAHDWAVANLKFG